MADNTAGMPPGWSFDLAPSGEYYFSNNAENYTTWFDPRNETLAPLPPGYRRGVDAQGRAYFATPHGTTQWCDPRKHPPVSVPPPPFQAAALPPPPPDPSAQAQQPAQQQQQQQQAKSAPSAPTPSTSGFGQPPADRPGGMVNQQRTVGGTVVVQRQVTGAEGGSGRIMGQRVVVSERSTGLNGADGIARSITKMTKVCERIYSNVRTNKTYYSNRKEQLKRDIADVETTLGALIDAVTTSRKEALANQDIRRQLMTCVKRVHDMLNTVESKCRGNAIGGKLQSKSSSFYGSRNTQEMAASIRQKLSQINVDVQLKMDLTGEMAITDDTSVSISHTGDSHIATHDAINLDWESKRALDAQQAAYEQRTAQEEAAHTQKAAEAQQAAMQARSAASAASLSEMPPPPPPAQYSSVPTPSYTAVQPQQPMMQQPPPQQPHYAPPPPQQYAQSQPQQYAPQPQYSPSQSHQQQPQQQQQQQPPPPPVDAPPSMHAQATYPMTGSAGAAAAAPPLAQYGSTGAPPMSQPPYVSNGAPPQQQHPPPLSGGMMAQPRAHDASPPPSSAFPSVPMAPPGGWRPTEEHYNLWLDQTSAPEQVPFNEWSLKAKQLNTAGNTGAQQQQQQYQQQQPPQQQQPYYQGQQQQAQYQ